MKISGYYFLVDFLEIVLLVIDTDLCENGRGTKVFAEEVDFPAGIKWTPTMSLSEGDGKTSKSSMAVVVSNRWSKLSSSTSDTESLLMGWWTLNSCECCKGLNIVGTKTLEEDWPTGVLINDEEREVRARIELVSKKPSFWQSDWGVSYTTLEEAVLDPWGVSNSKVVTAGSDTVEELVTGTNFLGRSSESIIVGAGKDK